MNTRQKEFVRNYAIGGTTATKAYAKAYKRDEDATAGANGHKLLQNTEIQKEVKIVTETVQQMAMKDVEKAYAKKVQLMNSKSTPASTVNQIASEIIALSGQGAISKIETKNETSFKGITDMTREQLRDMLK